MRIRTEYLGRVEGEAGVSFKIEGGRLKDLRINIWEPPRFFEGMLVGRRYDEVPDIVARICGICPVSHMLTSIRAIEKAIGFEPAPETLAARKLMAYSQIASSHLVHLVMLALPDYEGQGKGENSLMEVLRLPDMEKSGLLKKFTSVKEALNGITRAFGGRALHPVSMVVGGFTSLPGETETRLLISALGAAERDMEDIAEMMSELKLPQFESASVPVSLSEDGGYAVNSGLIVSGAGLEGQEDDYERLFEEKEALYSNAKKTSLKRGGQIMTGALARVSLQHRWLAPKARKPAFLLVEGPPSQKNKNKKNKNPFHNITAQAVELLHFWQECKELLEAAAASLNQGRQKPLRGIPPAREGKGSALTEAPRGLLYHSYEVDRTGTVRRANIVTPTAHNYLAMEQDLSGLVEANIGMPEERLKGLAEMLIRAYDPCFSCSVH